MTLAVNQLIGFGAVSGAQEPAAVRKTYRGKQVDTTNLTTYTFTVPVNSGDTYIAVACYFLSASANNFSSISMTGNVSGARSPNALSAASVTAMCGLSIATISGDTSVEVSFTLAAGGTCGAIAAWSGNGTIGTASGTVDTSHPYALTTDVADGGLGFVGAINSDTTPPTISLTGAGWTKEEDFALEGGIVVTAVSAEGPVTATCSITYSSSANPGRAAGLYVPAS